MEDSQWDQRLFDTSLKEYMKVSARTFAEIINTKGYYVARKALWFTRKAEPGAIRGSLGSLSRSTIKGPHGRRKTVTRLNLAGYSPGQKNMLAPLAVLIVQARARNAGHPSPWAGKSREAGEAAMTAAIRNLIVARIRSISFLKSGWLPAIKEFAPLVKDKAGLPPASARQVGKPKGKGIPASAGFICRASIENFARTIKDPRFSALTRHGAPALQRAFDDEAASMWEYVKGKMEPDATAFNAQQSR
jgi:hypothetical protein